MRLRHKLALHAGICAIHIVFVTADVRFTRPGPGQSIAAGGALHVEWEESGHSPALSEFSSYSLFLCAGGNDPASIVQLIDITPNGDFGLGNAAERVIPPTLGASSPNNAYFLKMISVAKTGGIVINYSPRFSMTGMSGVFPTFALDGLKSATGTNGPPTENDIGQSQETTDKYPKEKDTFSMAFADQSGPFRYATMQRVPPTKITKKTMKPVNPTSPYTIATTFLPPQKSIQKTITESVTWSYSQAEHSVAPVSNPTADDMERYLNRWKD